jgi:hypothetical protein
MNHEGKTRLSYQAIPPECNGKNKVDWKHDKDRLESSAQRAEEAKAEEECSPHENQDTQQSNHLEKPGVFEQ